MTVSTKIMGVGKILLPAVSYVIMPICSGCLTNRAMLCFRSHEYSLTKLKIVEKGRPGGGFRMRAGTSEASPDLWFKSQSKPQVVWQKKRKTLRKPSRLRIKRNAHATTKWTMYWWHFSYLDELEVTRDRAGGFIKQGRKFVLWAKRNSRDLGYLLSKIQTLFEWIKPFRCSIWRSGDQSLVTSLFERTRKQVSPQ